MVLQNTLFQGASKQDPPGLSEALLGTRFVFLAVSEASVLFLKAHIDHEENTHADCLSGVKEYLYELEDGCPGSALWVWLFLHSLNYSIDPHFKFEPYSEFKQKNGIQIFLLSGGTRSISGTIHFKHFFLIFSLNMKKRRGKKNVWK